MRNFFSPCVYAATLAALHPIAATAQGTCSEEGLLFSTQVQLEAFVAARGCTIDTIHGDLLVDQYVTDLSPLLGLRYVGGQVYLNYPPIRNYHGLDSLDFVGLAFIGGSIESATGLEKLRSIGSLPPREFESFPYTLMLSSGIAGDTLPCGTGPAPYDLSAIRGIDLHGGTAWFGFGGRCVDLNPLANVTGVRSVFLSAFTEQAYWPRALPYDSLDYFVISNSPRLERIDFLPHLRAAGQFEASACERLEAIELLAGLTLVPTDKGKTYPRRSRFEITECPRLERVDVDLDARGPWGPYQELHVKLYRAPLIQELRGLERVPASSFTVAETGLESLTFTSGAQGGRFINEVFVVDNPHLRHLTVAGGLARIQIARNSMLEEIAGRGAEGGHYFEIGVEDCPRLRSVELLQTIRALSLDSFNGGGGLALRKLPNFAFQPGDFDRFERGVALEFRRLTGTRYMPSLPSLKSLYTLYIDSVAFDTFHLDAPQGILLGGVTVLPVNDSMRGRIVRLDVSAPRLGRPYLRVPGVPEFSGSQDALGFDGVMLGQGFGEVTYSGLADCRRADGVVSWATGTTVVSPGAELLPVLDTVAYYGFVDQLGTSLVKLGNPKTLVPIDIPPPSNRGPNFGLWNCPNLTDAKAACEILRLGRFAVFSIADNAPPFDTKQGLLRYCDTVRVSALPGVAEGPWHRLSVNPTVSAPGAEVRVRSLAAFGSRPKYVLVGAGGAVVGAGQLPGAGAGIDEVALVLPEGLAAGEYWLHVTDERGGSGTAVVVIH